MPERSLEDERDMHDEREAWKRQERKAWERLPAEERERQEREADEVRGWFSERTFSSLPLSVRCTLADLRELQVSALTPKGVARLRELRDALDELLRPGDANA